MRYLNSFIEQDLAKKMVFVAGPRQVGKTTLSRNMFDLVGQGRYFNWDFDEDRKAIQNKLWSKDDQLLIFDELHKFPRWKSWVKGIFDVLGKQHRILVTGSARLDVYRQGGDSMLGRYFYWRLHPFTLDEIPPACKLNTVQVQDRLLTVGGFPEPFLAADDRDAARWRNARFDRILQEDVRDLESIKDIQKLRLFLDLLRTRVGGLVVLNNLAQDVLISAPTAKSWLEALERMYLLFIVRPYTQGMSRALQKPSKVYFFDNADVIDDEIDPLKSGARFENFVATHLLKRLQFIEDRNGLRCELRYIRDKEGREVDFLILVNNEPIQLIEVKLKDSEISKSLRYYWQRMRREHKRLQAFQIVKNLNHPYDQDGIRVTSALDYFAQGVPWLQAQKS